MVGVVGIALKGFGKALKVVKDTGLHKGSVRKATSPKVMGTQRPKTKSDFSLKHQVKQIQKSPGGSHICYAQKLNDIPVYRSDLLITLNTNNEIVFIANCLS